MRESDISVLIFVWRGYLQFADRVRSCALVTCVHAFVLHSLRFRTCLALAGLMFLVDAQASDPPGATGIPPSAGDAAVGQLCTIPKAHIFIRYYYIFHLTRPTAMSSSRLEILNDGGELGPR